MPAEILLRIAMTVGIIILGLVVYQLTNRVVLTRAHSQAGQMRSVQNGKPAILYFTTPDCVVCKTSQRPALFRLQERLGDEVQVIEVDAYEKPDMAKTWGVMSVPTTFILDAEGKARHVNHGVTSTEKLIEQVRAVEVDFSI
jgi:thiol-disulfide isomerase/thioredoxin